MELLFALLMSALRLATPMAYASLGGALSERSGVVALGLEGFMLIGAFAAAAIAYYTGSPWLAWCAAFLAGGAFAAIYAWFVVYWRADQIVAGMAMNLLAFGSIPFLLKILFDSTGSSPSLPIEARFQWFPILFLPLLLAFVMYLFYKTPIGLRISVAGEHPHALESAGVRVLPLRFWSVVASGALAGLGGACLSLFLSSAFTRNMSSGRGFMALAALIFGKWHPLPAVLACLFFGLADAIQIRLQGIDLGIPAQWIQALPYIVTIIVLAGFVGRARAPKMIGRPFE